MRIGAPPQPQVAELQELLAERLKARAEINLYKKATRAQEEMSESLQQMADGKGRFLDIRA